MATLFPTAPSSLLSLSRPSSRWAHTPYPTLIAAPFPRQIFCSSSSSAQPTVVEADEDSPSPLLDEVSNGAEPSDEGAEIFQLRGCKTCGREEMEKGCNGEGRIQGGIATVPGFGWWPIKAFRPCPGFVESGGKYRRRGQSMDEVAFGREKEDTVGGKEKVKSSKRKESPMKFRRSDY